MGKKRDYGASEDEKHRLQVIAVTHHELIQHPASLLERAEEGERAGPPRGYRRVCGPNACFLTTSETLTVETNRLGLPHQMPWKEGKGWQPLPFALRSLPVHHQPGLAQSAYSSGSSTRSEAQRCR